MASGRTAAIDLGANVVWPAVVLTWGGAYLGAQGALLAALAVPLGHAIVTRIRLGRTTPLSVVAVGGILISGGIGLLQLDSRWFAVKEALVPIVLGALTIASQRSPWPVIPTLLNELMDTDALRVAIEERGNTVAFERAQTRATWGLGGAMAASGLASAAFAAYLVQSPAGSEAYLREMGRYTAWSVPAITIPTLFAGVFGGSHRAFGRQTVGLGGHPGGAGGQSRVAAG